MYDRSTLELTVPLTLLSGLGEVTCLFRAGALNLLSGLEETTRPLERVVEMLLQGPAAFSGLAPICPPSDRFCLGAHARRDIIYQFIIFPMFYLHFWSLGSPSKLCSSTMLHRFTITVPWTQLATSPSKHMSCSCSHRKGRAAFKVFKDSTGRRQTAT